MTALHLTDEPTVDFSLETTYWSRWLAIALLVVVVLTHSYNLLPPKISMLSSSNVKYCPRLPQDGRQQILRCLLSSTCL